MAPSRNSKSDLVRVKTSDAREAVARARKQSDPPPRESSFENIEEEITDIHEQIDEIRKRPVQPSAPEIHVHVGKTHSDPPTSLAWVGKHSKTIGKVAATLAAGGSLFAALQELWKLITH